MSTLVIRAFFCSWHRMRMSRRSSFGSPFMENPGAVRESHCTVAPSSVAGVASVAPIATITLAHRGADVRRREDVVECLRQPLEQDAELLLGVAERRRE